LRAAVREYRRLVVGSGYRDKQEEKQVPHLANSVRNDKFRVLILYL
jgi:hypothetical protein